MNELKDYFYEDCGSAEDAPLYEAYEKGYNRAFLNIIENYLKEINKLKTQYDRYNAAKSKIDEGILQYHDPVLYPNHLAEF